MIVHEKFGDRKGYREFFEKKLWRSLLSDLSCSEHTPNSPCALIGWGSWQRKARDPGEEDGGLLSIQRLYCTSHHKTLSLIPPFLLPRLHYVAPFVHNVVERFVQGETLSQISRELQAPEEGTIRRWVRRIGRQLETLKQNLLSTIGNAFYTGDERQLQEAIEPYRDSKRQPKLIQVWGLLKMLATRKAENRSPFHYVMTYT